VPDGNEVVTFRTSLNTLGDGFVEAIADDTLRAISSSQPAAMRGDVIEVPVFEAPGVTRVGRFGWKNQMASLLSFSSDAYLNEMGITNRFNLVENTSMGLFVGYGSPLNYDPVPDNQNCTIAALGVCGEDKDDDISEFAAFMRATKAPPRAAGNFTAGQNIFNAIGCNVCHTPTIVTAPVGTPINGGTLLVPAALGDKVIHPFSDFLLHDIGTGDGIVQNGGANSRNKMRTAPLWGLRTHSRFMHDSLSPTLTDAIYRHLGEARQVLNRFRPLKDSEKAQLLAFLRSL
jgi:CxxC motif-containing protein (DUF1111 family)